MLRVYAKPKSIAVINAQPCISIGRRSRFPHTAPEASRYWTGPARLRVGEFLFAHYRARILALGGYLHA